MTPPEALGFVLEAAKHEAQALQEDEYNDEAAVLRQAIQVVADHHYLLL